MNELVLSNKVELTNKTLKKATDRIIKASENVNKNMFTIARELNDVSESKCYTDDGFKNVGEYAEKVFGFKKSATYNFISIGKLFTDTATLTSNLEHTDHDYSVSQLTRLVPLGSSEVANELIEKGLFNEDSTIKEIEKVVKDYLNPDIVEGEATEVDSEPVEEDGEPVEEPTPNNKSFEIVRVDNNGVWQTIIRDSNTKSLAYMPDTVCNDSLEDCLNWLREALG